MNTYEIVTTGGTTMVDADNVIKENTQYVFARNGQEVAWFPFFAVLGIKLVKVSEPPVRDAGQNARPTTRPVTPTPENAEWRRKERMIHG